MPEVRVDMEGKLISEQLVELLETLAQRAEGVTDRVMCTTEKASLREQQPETGSAPPVEAWPPLFQTMRNSVQRIDYQLDRIIDAMNRLQI